MCSIDEQPGPWSPPAEEDDLTTLRVSATVVLTGELDISTEREIENRISRLAELADVITIDARQVVFIDAAGLRTLRVAKRQVLDNGAAITLQIQRPGVVQRLVELLGLPDCLD